MEIDWGNDDEKPPEEEKPQESSSWFSPSSWFSSRDKKSTEHKWESGKYQSDFFNKFDPKKVFDKRTKESKELRKKIISSMFEEVFRIDDRAQYFKDLSLERSARDDINLVYKGRPIATFSTKHETITQKRGKPLADFKQAVKIYHNFITTQELKPQVVEILNPQKEEEFNLPELLDEIETLKYSDEEETSFYKEEPERAPTPERTPTPPPKIPSTSSSFLNYAAKGFSKMMDTISNTNGDPKETAVNTSQTRTAIENNMDYMSLKNDIESMKNQLEEKKNALDDAETQIEEKNKRISLLKKALVAGDELGVLKISNLEKEVERLTRQRDSMTRDFQRAQSQGFKKDDQIKDLEDKLNLAGKQLIDKNKEIDSTKEKLKKLQDYVDQSKDNSSSVSSQLSETQNKLKTLQTEYDQLLTEYKTKEKEMEDLRKDIPNRVSKALASLKKITDKDKKDIKNLKDFQKSLEKTNKILEENIKALETNYKAEQAVSKDLKDQKDKLITDLETQKKQYDDYLKKGKGTDKELLETRQKLTAIEKELADEKKFSADLQKQRDRLEKDYKDLESKYKKFKKEVNSHADKLKLNIDKTKKENEDLEKANKELSTSVQNYKTSLDVLTEQHKRILEEKEKKLQEANTQIQDLQDKFEKKEISLESYKKKLKESQNKFTLAKKRYEETLSLKDQKVNELLKEKEMLQKNNEKLEEDIHHSKDRITAKEEEIQGYLEEIRNKKEEIEKISTGLSQKDLYAEQFKQEKAKYDKLIQDHKDLVHKANQTQMDKHELESELERLQKETDSTKQEMEKLKQEMIDPKLLEESRENAKELAKQLTEKEQELDKKVKEYKKEIDDVKKQRDTINKQKEEYETKLEKQKNEYEKKLETLRKRKKEFMTSKELKELGDDLDKIDAESYQDLNYDETIKRWRDKRDEYDRKSKDTKNTVVKRLEYERSKKFVNEKIDLLNYKFNKPIETQEGKEIVKKLKRSQMWFWQKWYQDAKDHKYGILGFLLSTILGGITTFASAALYNTLYYTTEAGKAIAPHLVQAGAKVGINTAIDLILAVPKFLLWVADHMVEFILGAISTSVFLYKEYGEEAAFPILAFWSCILAMGMFGLHYLNTTYEKAKSYNPLTS